MRRPFVFLALVVVAGIAAPARAGALLPSMVQVGPYGDPLLLRPALLPSPVAASAILFGEASVASVPMAGVASLVPWIGTTGGETVASALPRGHDDDLPPVTPGTFKPIPTRLPGVLLKTRTVTNHLDNPDVAVALSKRATIGLFGEVGKVEIEQGAGLLPTVRARDVGAGVSLQYRFGQ